MSLSTNRPTLVNESDCEISLPSPLNDRYIWPNEPIRSSMKPVQFTGFVVTIHMTRLYAQLQQTLKSSIILS